MRPDRIIRLPSLRHRNHDIVQLTGVEAVAGE